MIGGSLGSRFAMAWVMRIVRPNDVSTISAPCSWAIRATWNAMEVSISTPVTRSRLPSRMPISRRSSRRGCQWPIPRPPSTGTTAPVT